MVNIDLDSKEIGLIHYIAGLATAKLESEKGKDFLHNDVFPLLTKLSEALANWERTNIV